MAGGWSRDGAVQEALNDARNATSQSLKLAAKQCPAFSFVLNAKVSVTRKMQKQNYLTDAEARTANYDD